MKIVLYGGAFDPPHIGHMEIAAAAYEKVCPDKLIWIPSKNPPHRKIEGESAENRLKMLRKWTEDKPEYGVSDAELEKEHSGYTVETVRKYKNNNPRAKLFILIGTDEAEDFKSWKDYKKIISMSTPVIGRRKKRVSLPSVLKENAVCLENGIYDVSSSELRKLLYSGKGISGYVDKVIEEYIKAHNLYKK